MEARLQLGQAGGEEQLVRHGRQRTRGRDERIRDPPGRNPGRLVHKGLRSPLCDKLCKAVEQPFLLDRVGDVHKSGLAAHGHLPRSRESQDQASNARSLPSYDSGRGISQDALAAAVGGTAPLALPHFRSWHRAQRLKDFCSLTLSLTALRTVAPFHGGPRGPPCRRRPACQPGTSTRASAQDLFAQRTGRRCYHQHRVTKAILESGVFPRGCSVWVKDYHLCRNFPTIEDISAGLRGAAMMGARSTFRHEHVRPRPRGP